MAASAPSRSSGKGVLNFGLVSIPVRTFNGVDDEAGKIKRHMRTPSGNPVAFPTADACSGEVIQRGECHYVYVTDDKKEVTLSDEEMDSASGLANGTWNLVGFYPNEEANTFFFQGLLQVRPDVVKSGSKTTQPYDAAFALLMASMAERDVFALVEFVSRGSHKVGVLTSDGYMRLAFHADEVREQVAMPDTSGVTTAEMAMALTLVDAMTGTDPVCPENEAVQKIRAYAETKAADPTKAVDVQEAAEAKGTVDLMAALAASVQAAQKSA